VPETKVLELLPHQGRSQPYSAAATYGFQLTTPLTVELLTPQEAAAFVTQWRHLAETCLEPNVFLNPDFALPAARHIAHKKPPRFLFVWEAETGGQRRLAGVCPLAHAGPFARFLPTRIWTHKQTVLGTPLLDRGHAEDVFAAIFTYCRTHLPKSAGLLFPMLPQEGELTQVLMAGAAADGRGIEIFAAHRRACLTPGPDSQNYLDTSISSNRRRKLKRARKLLEARGMLTFRVATAPHDIQAATETFLAIEAKGWKGRHGTAFLNSPELAAFAREVAAQLGAGGQYIAASLHLDGQALAVGLILKSGGRAFWWKIAYDETFAIHSPGALLACEVTQLLLADTQILLTDSCTQDDDPMIDHIWSERMGIADILVAVSAEHPKKFAALARRETLRRTLRSRLKAAVLCLQQRMRA
jgi:hypothetical protein